MSIVNDLKLTLERTQENLEREASFQELQRFYAEMKEKGFVIRKEYTLPPLDTVGHYSQESTVVHPM